MTHPPEGRIRFVDEPSKDPVPGVAERRFDPLRSVPRFRALLAKVRKPIPPS